jgi:redox-sensitive bicupin YhaK (pirin superfamily)
MLDVAHKNPIAVKISASTEKVGAGLMVLRALPTPELEAVGPFVFLDHIGPAAPPAGGVPAHPHAGIEVVTYLLEGGNDHRDSMGNHSAIESGGAQWITSGRGMLHAEFPRGGADGLMHGVQLWTRQPRALDDAAPTYKAVTAEEIPRLDNERGRLRLLVGDMPGLFSAKGPIALAAPAQLLHVTLGHGGSFAAPLKENYEMGVYVLSGVAALGYATALGGADVGRGELAVLAPAASVTIHNQGAAPLDLLLLGGERAERPLVFRGSFVFNSREAIDRAFGDYADGRMGRLDGVPF